MKTEKNTYQKILKLLSTLQEGYIKRDLEHVESIVDEIFSCGDELLILGTASSEVFTGREGAIELLRDDFEYWGDFKMDLSTLITGPSQGLVWFSVKGKVKYTFEHTDERDKGYINFIKDKLNDKTMSNEQKAGFINWVLTLNYHRHLGNPREYWWPCTVVGACKLIDGEYKISNLVFSMDKSIFPDERFENSNSHQEGYQVQLDEFNKIISRGDTNNYSELSSIINNFNSSELRFDKNNSCAISGEGEIFDKSTIENYFNSEFLSEFEIEDKSFLVNENDDSMWVTLVGKHVKELDSKELLNHSLQNISEIIDSDDDARDKLFKSHRSLAYYFKETITGENHTYPVRISLLLNRKDEEQLINFIHISYPFYWIFEGKID